jgi:hypothetical protein
MSSRSNISAHDWVSFEEEDGSTWLFDLTFLTSRWECIFGNGCKGVLTEDATELGQGCCSYGAHFVDTRDRDVVKKAARRLTSEQWQFKRETKAAGGPFAQHEGDWITIQIEDACCFLNRPEFPGGAGCALHSAALEAGERPMDWKPDVCWQLPLRLVTDVDQNDNTTYTLREWRRRDWGEGGEDFHWWCTDSPEAFRGSRKVYEYLADEITEMIGADRYAWLVDHITSRPSTHFLPHPKRKAQEGAPPNRL